MKFDMRNRRGEISLEGAGQVILVVVFCLFILAIIAASFGGFGTEKDRARQAAVDIAKATASAHRGATIESFEVSLAKDWTINVDSENRKISVLKGDDVDETYTFGMPSGYSVVCCPKELGEGDCSTYCGDTLVLKGKLEGTFCVTTMSGIDSLGIGDRAVSRWLHSGESAVFVYPKRTGRTCTDVLGNVFGL